MKILVIIPISGLSEQQINERIDYLESIAEEDKQIDSLQLENGPQAIECPVDHLYEEFYE